MKIYEQFKQSFISNPIVWILAGLLAFSIYSHYRTGKMFTSACDDLLTLSEDFYESPVFDSRLARNLVASW
jgi:hypothetical protein